MTKKKIHTKSFYKGWKQCKEINTVSETNPFYLIGIVVVVLSLLGFLAKALAWLLGINDCLIN